MMKQAEDLETTVKEFAKQAPLEGVTPVMFSISASEGPNILLRNFLGKIATNLSVGLDLKRLPSWHLIDGFADEGHRIGAYYMFRAISIAFYESLNPSIALRVVSSWGFVIAMAKLAPDLVDLQPEQRTKMFMRDVVTLKLSGSCLILVALATMIYL